jgi:hypothetical protein
VAAGLTRCTVKISVMMRGGWKQPSRKNCLHEYREPESLRHFFGVDQPSR